MWGTTKYSWSAWCSAFLISLVGSALTGCGRQGYPPSAVADDQVAKKPTNRLGKETSPYLLLHAHNPVDWYPWGPEAFEKAKREKKLVFLSIGYSSCYWCHVMERLVFTNPEIAKYMNEHFVNIKVDREERPDVDEIYMTALQIYFQAIGSSQTGGWPLSIFLTPDLKPLGGGTYFPPEDSEGRDGFLSILKRIHGLWDEDHEKLQKTGDALAGAVREASQSRAPLNPVKLEQKLVQRSIDELKATYDKEYGGFDYNPLQPTRPKFPVPVKLSLIQAYLADHPKDSAAEMLYNTLDKLAAGGIHDQLGGGFHRYSTDRYWRVPHFEKMLYDNAQLADVYVAAYKATNNPVYRSVAEDLFAFVMRELTDSQGAFYSALDAETNGVEGQYYVWTRDEVKQVLTPDEVRMCAQYYGMDREPNFEKAYVLEVVRPISKLADEFQLKASAIDGRLQNIRTKLLAARGKRPPLLRDDKVLTSWNGLMIRALAHAARDLNRPEYLNSAESAATFILSKMRDDKGRLLRTYRAQVAKVPAYLDDYAFLIEGLLAIYEVGQQDKWLNAAVRLNDQQRELFWDEKQHGYYYMGTDHEELLARTKTKHDSVLPSGNSVAARNLIRLANYTHDSKYLRDAELTLVACAPILEESPRGAVNLAIAVTEYLAAKPKESGSRNRSKRDLATVDEEPQSSNDTIEDDAVEQAGLNRSADGLLNATAGDSQGLASSATRTGKGTKRDEIALLQNESSEPGESEPAPKKTAEMQPVSGKALLASDRLPAGGTCKFVVILNIEDGWHINSNPAGDEFAIATELKVKSKWKVTVDEDRIRYPKAEVQDVPGLKEQLHFYSKQVEIRGVLDVPPGAAGKEEVLDFLVKYQACNDKKCLRPMTLSIKVPVTVAKAGVAVTPANQKWFSKEKEKTRSENN